MEKNKTTVTGDNTSVHNTDIEEISRLIDELVVKLNTTEIRIHDKSDIISSIETLKIEVNKEKPSKITMMSIGKTILENLKYVKGIAPSIHLIWDKLTILITR